RIHLSVSVVGLAAIIPFHHVAAYLRISIAVAALACVGSALAQQSPLLQVGPLRLGMSPDELRAATPGTEWGVARKSKYTGRILVVSASQVGELAGIRFAATAGIPYHSGHWILLEHTQTASTAMEREAQVLALITELEAHTATFSAWPPNHLR